MTIDPQTFVIIFALVVVLAALLIWRTLRTLHTQDNAYNLQDLLMENGKASRLAHVMMGSFAATTWFFIYYALAGKMTEGYFGLYAAAWITPIVARFIGGNIATPAAIVTTTETVTTTKAKNELPIQKRHHR